MRRATLASATALIGALALVAGVVAQAGRADGERSERAALTAAGDAARRWAGLPDARLARSEVAAARIGDAAYVVGGFIAGGATTAAVERVDLRSGQRRRVAPMPVALNHPAAATWRGRLYVVGGYRQGLAQESAALLRYEPRSGRWTRLADMPTPRGALTAGVVDGRLVAAGGARGGTALETVEIYDTRSGRWRAGPPLRVAREHLAGAVLGGRFYVLAGRTAAGGNLTAAERIGPRLRRWETLPSSRRRRGGTAAAAAAGSVVLVGGEDLTPGGSTISEVEAFDPRARRWRALPDMRTPRHGLGVVSREGSVFAVAGGRTPGFSLSAAVERLVVSR